MTEAEKAADRAGHFEAVLHQVAFLLERNDPGREGHHSTKSDREVALSMIKSALAYDAKTYPATGCGADGCTLPPGHIGSGGGGGSITIIAHKVENTGTIGGEGGEVLRVEGPDVFKPKA